MATDKLVEIDHGTGYISREAAYDALTDYYHHRTDIQHQALREAINSVPAADVQPVVRSAWILVQGINEDYAQFCCKTCGAHRNFRKDELKPFFCAWCGADMREEGRDGQEAEETAGT